MIDLVYVEDEVRDHVRTVRILRQLPRATVVPCARYGEVFNRRGQSFRLQKTRPALILAAKHDRHVLPAPPGFAIGPGRSFYFSHMLNCFYDCRYCFLQGMYRSAHYVLFVNYEDFTAAIDRELAAAPGAPCVFFSGYDCDSLAAEGLSGFAAHFLPLFAARADAWLELRTKSTQIGVLRSQQPWSRCVVAWSFTPAPVAAALEHRLPSFARRLEAMTELAARGWPLGLRLDPLIHHRDFRRHYQELIDRIFAAVPAEAFHSVSLGAFRLPRDFHRRLERQHPDAPLLAAPLAERDGVVSYRSDLEAELTAACSELLARHLPAERVFSCTS